MKTYAVTYLTGGKSKCPGVMIVVAEDKRSALKLAKAEMKEGHTMEDIELIRTTRPGVAFNQEPSSK